MPTYDYRCFECENLFEIFHGMNESPSVACPDCNGESKKIFSPGAGIVFKGAGFYVNDYKKATSETNPAKKSETSAEKKAENQQNNESSVKTESKSKIENSVK